MRQHESFTGIAGGGQSAFVIATQWEGINEYENFGADWE
jgi:hypothetical protein